MIESVERIGDALGARGWRLTSAESCTGGLIASTATSIAGSSAWFECGFVTYHARSKIRLLGVSAQTIDEHTVVSEPVAREMALGALNQSDATLSVAVTGIAGPGGGEAQTPVGTVWLAWALKDPEPVCLQASRFDFRGDRADIREQATRAAFDGIATILFR